MGAGVVDILWVRPKNGGDTMYMIAHTPRDNKSLQQYRCIGGTRMYILFPAQFRVM